MAWTKDQEAVIWSRGGDLLVSAAAGSGKTAVLVERILTMICEEESGVDIDKMLIVTFTKAAAAEMKERIGMAIERTLQEDPDNEHLRKQSAYLQKAQISTIHSFCLQLIRDHFNMLGIDPEFRMIDEGEGKLLKTDVLKQVLEEFYEEGREEFHLLVEGYTNGKDDKALEEMVQTLYEFAMSNPEPEVWLQQAKERLCMKTKTELFESSYMKELLSHTKILIEELYEKNQLAIELAKRPNGPLAYEKTLELDQAYLESLMEIESYDGYQKAMAVGGFTRMSGRPAKETDEGLKATVKQLRDEVKEQLTSWKEQFFSRTPEDMLLEVFLVKKPMEALIDLVLAFKEQFAKAKETKNVMDFGDLEHYALELLVDHYEEGKAIPSTIATELAKNYVEIFIDEYQDSNFIQEAILSSISGMIRGENNRFMVGDVKQSIYRFRLARPEIFMEKYDRYQMGGKQEKKIELHKNFRSRASVLEATNYVFRQLMGRDLGGVEYDEEASLVAGKQFPKREEKKDGEEEVFEELSYIDPKDKTELIIVESQESEYTKKELEAHAIAKKIHELMDEENPYTVYDEKLGSYRPVEYRDIVILLRTVSGWGEVLEEVLLEEGIPAHGDSQKGYFSTIEVQNMLNLLRIVDNRYQEIPLVGVLRSPMVGLKGEELAWIKAVFGSYGGKELALYDSLVLLAEEEFCETKEEEKDECSLYEQIKHRKEEQLLLGKTVDWCISLQETVQQFLALLEELEQGKTCMSIHDLIWLAMNRTNYFYYVGAMPQGEKRQANLLMLIEKANQYEKVSYKGLFHFIRYMNQLREYEVDFGEASVLGEHENVVRIMSIHKSKGLEFPVVFVGELNKPFNFSDLRQKLLIHADDYLGPDCIDLETRQSGPTWLKDLIQMKLKEETLGEELRVFYVAMTRAKEKLILVGTVDDYEKKYSQFSYVRYQWEKRGGEAFRLARTIRTKASCYLDWMLSALVIPQDFITITVIGESEFVFQEVEKKLLSEQKKEQLEQLQSKEENKEIVTFLKQQLDWQYPFEEEVEARGKYSVSELKKIGQLEEGEDYFNLPQREQEEGLKIEGNSQSQEEVFRIKKLEEIPEEERIRPAFMMGEEEQEEMVGAMRGTFIHKIMELLDVRTVVDSQSLNRYLDQLEERQLLTKEQRRYLPIRGILSFIQSDIGKRVKVASDLGRLYKESQYMMGMPTNEVVVGSETKEMVLLQGVIDLWFEEEDGLVLIDYKTDRVSEESELKKRYQIQLNYYKKALEQMTGKNVKEAYFYSFALKQFVRG